MILIIVVGAYFFNYAKRNNMNKILWAILGIASYFIGQVVAGAIIGLTAPDLLQEDITIMFIGVLAGGLTTYLTYLLMVKESKKKQDSSIDSDILDSDLLE